MNGRHLARQLAFVVLAKLAFIAALWGVFVADLRLDVDAAATAARLLAAAGAVQPPEGGRP